VVARVGNRDIHRDDVAAQRKLTGKTDADALEQLIDRELLASQAEARGLKKQPEVQARLRAAEREVLAQAVAASVADALTETQALERYKADKKQFAVRTIHVAQLVFLAPPQSTQPQLEAARSRATAAWAKLLGGADFAELARTTSEEPSTGSKGGELALIHEGEIAQPLFEELVALAAGAITRPIQGPSGFHLFKALDSPGEELPEFGAIKGRIVAQLRSEAQKALREQLVKEVPVKRYPERMVEEAGR
jgi:peptidylprolyl isomerase